MSATNSSAVVDRPDTAAPTIGPKPLPEAPQSRAAVALWVFVAVPFVALATAVPVAWGWGLSPAGRHDGRALHLKI